MFIGRQVELEAVAASLCTPGHVLTVIGDAGMGKSRLIGEAAAARNVGVLMGRCLPLSVDLPLMPVIDILRELLRGQGPTRGSEALAHCPSFVRAELARLLPELGDAAWGDPQRQLQFEAIRRVLVEARTSPLVIDDLHWCDTASLDLLEYLIVRPDAPPVVLAVRPLAEASTRIQQWLGRILRLKGSEQLDLNPLGVGEVGAMLDALGWAGTQDELSQVTARSAGNPYYVEQLANVDVMPAVLPRTLEALLQARLVGLGADGLDLMRVLSVSGRPVTDEELDVACDSRAGEALREVRARGLVVNSSKVGGWPRWSTSHALLAEAIRGQLTAPEVRRLHRRVADAFAAQPSVNAEDVARHLARAGDQKAESPWRLRAAEQARRRAAPREAFGHLARVITIDPTVAVEVYLEAYTLARHSGNTVAAADLAARMLARFEPTATEATRMRLWHAAGHHRVLHDPEGLDFLARAVAIGRLLTPTSDFGYALYDYVRHLRGRGYADRAQALGAELTRVAYVCADADLSRLVEVELACHALLDGSQEAASELIGKAQQGTAQAVGPGLNAAAMVTYLLLSTGRLTETIDYGRAAIADRVAAGLSAASVTGSLRADVAAGLLEQGRIDEAEVALGPVIAGLPAPDAAATAEMRTAVDVARGRTVVALHYWTTALPLMAYPGLISEAAPLVLSTMIESGRPADAVKLGMQALSTTLTCDQSRFAGATIALVRRALGDLVDGGLAPAAAQGMTASLDAAIGAAPVHPFASSVFPVTGAADGLTDTAEGSRVEGSSDPESWLTAAAAWRELGRPWRSGYCAWRGAQAGLAVRGTRPAAVEALRAAWSESAGHVPLRAAIANLAVLGRVELPNPSPHPPRPTSVFTERELAVIRLMADGKTNSEIGTELYMSPKTASVHVSNILRKFAVHTRVEAAGKAQRAGLLD